MGLTVQRAQNSLEVNSVMAIDVTESFEYCLPKLLDSFKTIHVYFVFPTSPVRSQGECFIPIRESCVVIQVGSGERPGIHSNLDCKSCAVFTLHTVPHICILTKKYESWGEKLLSLCMSHLFLY